MKNEEIMLKIENVSKVYKLGEIGGTTLRDELQRLKAKILHREDPTKKVGTKNYNKGEKFKALDSISLEVKKGERIGIIGHNGAGKSTLLKLISRVTGPTDGKIYLNGRVASMLEVGTGFHPELTGRENVYMNGAILGMTKKEIDAKMEDIIEFSEVRQFIDTPVKRYSSGMYVKLAFSVAAHLDSEIMIMDEVLAVGDVQFQNKCLQKMKDVSEQEDRTILYVSHNMTTIRQLCDRVIVLDNGKVVFDGNVEDGISCYLKENLDSDIPVFSTDRHEKISLSLNFCEITKVEYLKKENTVFVRGEPILAKIYWKSNADLTKVRFRITYKNSVKVAVGTCVSVQEFECKHDKEYSATLTLDTLLLSEDTYRLTISMINVDDANSTVLLEHLSDYCNFKIVENNSRDDVFLDWNSYWWGNIHFKSIAIDDFSEQD